MPQAATIKSLPAAFAMTIAMQEGVEWGEDDRAGARHALAELLDARKRLSRLEARRKVVGATILGPFSPLRIHGLWPHKKQTGSLFIADIVGVKIFPTSSTASGPLTPARYVPKSSKQPRLEEEEREAGSTLARGFMVEWLPLIELG